MVKRPAHIELFCAFLALVAQVSGQQTQIESARQLELTGERHEIESAPLGLSLPQSEGGQDLDSFGVQQMLVCGPERARPFRVFGDVSGFVTDNVGLSRRSPSADSFMVGSFGLGYQRPLKRGFQVDATFQVAMFRYNEFRQLDFNSIDVGAGLSYQLQKLGGVALVARYNFNALQGASSGDTFFQNHTITVGAEKVLQFSKAHYAVAGVSGRAGFADPRSNERHEIGAYAGCHIAVIPRLEVDMGYRYGYYIYTASDHRDHNHTASLGVRYGFTDWFSASASSFYVWNRSNEDVLSYNAGTLGGGLMFLLRF